MQLLLKQSGKTILSNQPKYFKILATRSLQGTAFVICGLLLTEAFAVSLLNQTPVNTHQRTPSYFRQITNVSPQAVKVGVDLCPTCIQFTGQAIDMLLNIILRKSTKIANFGIPNLQDFFFRIDSDFFRIDTSLIVTISTMTVFIFIGYILHNDVIYDYIWLQNPVLLVLVELSAALLPRKPEVRLQVPSATSCVTLQGQKNSSNLSKSKHIFLVVKSIENISNQYHLFNIVYSTFSDLTAFFSLFFTFF